jgi:hypothetical protein
VDHVVLEANEVLVGKQENVVRKARKDLEVHVVLPLVAYVASISNKIVAIWDSIIVTTLTIILL